MKYIIILGDGMADQPIEALGGRTPLQAAHKPNIDRIAAMGRNGMLLTVPEGYPPGSEIANLSLLGYDVGKVYEGRGSLEAASMGVKIGMGEMAMRCNLICIQDGKIKNHSAGHISNEEARELILFLDKKMVNKRMKLHPGVSYRHLLVMKEGDKALQCTPPHDVPGRPFADVMIKPQTPEAQATANLLNELILDSQKLLAPHPINLKRVEKGRDPANSLWPWSPGYRPDMQTLQQLYGIGSGSVISAVDLIMGIGVYAGLKPVMVEGATGLYNTNYEGKAAAAIEALRRQDFVYLHIEASDEAGHEGDYELKKRTIEYLDDRIVRPIFKEISTWNEPVTIAILPDHPTPCKLKTHTADAVPFIICKTGETSDAVQVYDEFSAKKGAYGLLKGGEFMREFLNYY